MFGASSSRSGFDMEAYLKRISSQQEYANLDALAQAGVAELSAATPYEDGTTAASWHYEIVKTAGTYSVIWGNSNIVNGQNIAVLLQHGHATRTGGYVQGRDYINPALRGIFDKMAEEMWKVVTKQ